VKGVMAEMAVIAAMAACNTRRRLGTAAPSLCEVMSVSLYF